MTKAPAPVTPDNEVNLNVYEVLGIATNASGKDILQTMRSKFSEEKVREYLFVFSPKERKEHDEALGIEQVEGFYSNINDPLFYLHEVQPIEGIRGLYTTLGFKYSEDIPNQETVAKRMEEIKTCAELPEASKDKALALQQMHIYGKTLSNQSAKVEYDKCIEYWENPNWENPETVIMAHFIYHALAKSLMGDEDLVFRLSRLKLNYNQMLQILNSDIPEVPIGDYQYAARMAYNMLVLNSYRVRVSPQVYSVDAPTQDSSAPLILQKQSQKTLPQKRRRVEEQDEEEELHLTLSPEEKAVSDSLKSRLKNFKEDTQEIYRYIHHHKKTYKESTDLLEGILKMMTGARKSVNDCLLKIKKKTKRPDLILDNFKSYGERIKKLEDAMVLLKAACKESKEKATPLVPEKLQSLTVLATNISRADNYPHKERRSYNLLKPREQKPPLQKCENKLETILNESSPESLALVTQSVAKLEELAQKLSGYTQDSPELSSHYEGEIKSLQKAVQLSWLIASPRQRAAEESPAKSAKLDLKVKELKEQVEILELSMTPDARDKAELNLEAQELEAKVQKLREFVSENPSTENAMDSIAKLESAMEDIKSVVNIEDRKFSNAKIAKLSANIESTARDVGMPSQQNTEAEGPSAAPGLAAFSRLKESRAMLPQFDGFGY